MRRLERVWDHPYEVPTRIIQGTYDKVVDPRGAVDWLRRGEVTATEGKFLAKGRHEPFHDIEGAALLDEMLDWFECRVASRPDVLPFDPKHRLGETKLLDPNRLGVRPTPVRRVA